MPRRRYISRREEEEEDGEYDPVPEDTDQEEADVRAAPGIPTLREIRLHIMKHAWNGGECEPRMDNEQVFGGQCEYASTAISEILTGTGLRGKPVDWSLRVRGWYSGDLSAITARSACDEHAFSEGRHPHSWVEYNGKIYDATYWQFAGDEVRVYVFELDDPRFSRDPNS